MDRLVDTLKVYADSLPDSETVIRDVLGLMTVTAFAARTAGKEE